MKVKRQLILLVMLMVLCLLAVYCLPAHTGIVPAYDRYIYYPFQSARGFLLGAIPLSVGDVLYVLAGAGLLFTLGRWVFYIMRFKAQKTKLPASVLNTISTVLAVYLFFLIGWGTNYYKQPLKKYWGYREQDTTDTISIAELKAKTKNELVAFDSFLVGQLNDYAPHYTQLAFSETNERVKRYYRTYTDTRLTSYGLGVKPTLFGYFMERLAVEGYYNPFTGEGQVNNRLPAFLMPFLICHEVAHQAGIAAEGDANLMAYALCTATTDSTFRYSAYLDIWIYTNNKLFRRDSVMANKFEASLNILTTKHIDTLEQISKEYQNEYARYSTELYDSYLKMQDQKEGIRSYGNVASTAWILEQRREKGMDKVIRIP